MKGFLALHWGARSARLTTFRSSKPTGTSWWQLLHGSRAIRTSKKGAVVEESGLIEGQNLFLSDQPTRFDVVVTPDLRHASPEMPMHSLGTLDAVSQRMSQLALKLTTIKEFPTAHRLAFGITLNQVGFKRTDTLQTLTQVFPELSKELKWSEDFVFQISHPGREEFEDLEESSIQIRYLQKWYFAELKLEGGPQSRPIDAFTANVDLDISTGISPARKWSAHEAAQIIPRLIRGAKLVLERST
jgi:hypothetical protein